MMNQNTHFFDAPYSQEDLQRRVAQRRANGSRTSSMSLLSTTPTGTSPQMGNGGMDILMGGGDSLDDIIMQNNEMRRQNIPQGYGNQDVDNRRASMMEFGSANGSLNGFQFGQTQAPGVQGMRRQSAGEIDMAAAFPDMSSMSGAMNMGVGFGSPMQNQGPLSINGNSPFSQMSNDMMGNMMGYTPMGMEGLSEDGMNMFSPTSFPMQQQFGPSPMDQMGSDFMMQPNMTPTIQQRRGSISSHDGLQINSLDNSNVASPTVTHVSQNNVSFASPVATSIHHGLPPTPQNQNFITPMPSDPTPVPPQSNEMGPAPPPASKQISYDGIYSTSGFDMLGALMKVATRENPEIELGKVDLSCAFVVCDLTQYDCPIIYVSDNFEKLTGYNKHEVKGQNCRFLQSPDGKVEAGARRPFVDNDSVYYLKKKISEKKEAQRSLINYRKGGQPFMNLLTMIPITGEQGNELKYIVGFQVDLVQKPSSIDGVNKNPGGHWSIDYSQHGLPPFVWVPPENTRALDQGQTVSRDDVSTVLNAVNSNTESDLTRRMWDKILLENTDDVIHVLSLKGLFLYLSPSSRHVLEYDASELVGTALSSVCHPSDIVPVTRELKDTSAGASVNVVFRIRRKKSGYTWFESHGSLCVEQGKGRKCIILVGRERPVYALQRREIEAAGGIGESEMWTKLSTSGMFLYAPSNIRILLDRDPKDLIGTSFQQLMRKESQVEFGRALEKARTGKRITHKHDIFNKRGLVLQAQTTLYPGDAAEGSKPTFLVGQTRLLKSSSRGSASALPSHKSHTGSTSMSPNCRRDYIEECSTPISHPSNLSNMSSINQDLSTPKSSPSGPGPISQAGGSGLQIGSQDLALASEDNIFDELKTTRCTSWQFELRQMEKSNRLLTEELAALLQSKKKRKRRKGNGNPTRDCANCHTKITPEWRRGPSGQRDLCNSCGLRWAKQTGRVSPRTSNRGGDISKTQQSQSTSSAHSSPLQQEISHSDPNPQRPNLNPDPLSTGNIKGDREPNPNSPTVKSSGKGFGGKDGIGFKDGKGGMVGIDGGLGNGGRAAVPGSLGGRTTMESIPVKVPSIGYREGGKRGITNIKEGDERGA